MKKALLGVVALCAAACSSSSSGTTGVVVTTAATISGSTSSGTATGTTSGATTGASTAAATTVGATTSGTASATTSSGSATTSTGSSGTSGTPTGWSTVSLVDNDGNTGTTTNPSTDDFSLGFYQTWLSGGDTGEPAFSPALPTAYTYLEQASDSNDPTYHELDSAPTTDLIWFTADNYGGNETVSNAQDASLVAWLQTGGKTLILFAPSVFYDRGTMAWAGPETDPLLESFATGDSNNPPVVVAGSDTQIQDLTTPVVLSGGGNQYFQGKTWTLGAGLAASQYAGSTNYSVKFYWGAVNPVAGADVLATIQADPTSSGTNTTTPIIVGVKNATVGGMATTSTIVYVGLTPENINNGLATHTMQDLFAAIQQYAGL